MVSSAPVTSFAKIVEDVLGRWRRFKIVAVTIAILFSCSEEPPEELLLEEELLEELLLEEELLELLELGVLELLESGGVVLVTFRYSRLQ